MKMNIRKNLDSEIVLILEINVAAFPVYKNKLDKVLANVV